MTPRTIQAADLFCGAGGTSAGLYDAATELGFGVNLLAVNHWIVAIRSHSHNHKMATHLCESLDNVDPRKVVPGGRLDLLVASPECTHHSRARGGVPCSDQSRASATHIIRWAEALYIKNIVVENVPEFMDWGPLGANGRPLKSHKGEMFTAWVNSLRALNYNVEWRVLTSADYGDATSRERFILIARRGRRVRFPKPSHSQTGSGGLPRWRPARDIIDWTNPSRSIFGRRKPLVPATLKRIEAGLRKFCGKAAEPFLIILRGTGTVRSLDDPLPTITAGGQHFGLVQPFIMSFHGGEDSARRNHSIDEPLPTLDTSNRFGLVQPFMMHLTHQGSDTGRCHSVDEPVPTITGAHRGEIALVQPFLAKYYATGAARSVDEPLDTITTRDRFALVQPIADGRGIDIRLRMLQPDELAAATSLETFVFTGTKEDAVRQIGNAVPRRMAKAVCLAALT